MLAQAFRERVLVENLENNAAIVLVVILQSGKAENGGADVCVVSEQVVGHTLITDSRTHNT